MMNQVNKGPFKKTVHKLLMACKMSLLFCTELLAADIIQPKVYPSNNQTYALTVSPLKPSGLNGADYLLEKAGAPVWQKQQQKTAFMADVADSGESIYCSYSKGLEPPFDRDNPRDFGYMELSLLDNSGHLIWSQSIKRRVAMGFHKPPVPFCEQVMIHPHTSRAFYWYHQDQRKQLKTIDIKTGKSVKGIDFSLEHARDLTSIKDIKFHDMAGSDLFLVEITGWVDEKNEKGNGYYSYLSDALFYLLDSNGHIYWQKHLMGSLDIRKTTQEEKRQKVYRKSDAFLKQHDLIQVNHQERQFAITDYNSEQLHWYQINQKQEVNAIKSESLHLPLSPFEVEVNKQTNPTLLRTVDLKTAFDQEITPCSGRYDAIDVTAEGILLLFHEDSRSIIRVDDSVVSTFIIVPAELIKDIYIPHQLMFVGQSDQIFVNLGKANYAVYAGDGQYLETQVWEQGCRDSCFTDFVVQKSTGKLWSENREHQVTLAHLTEEGYMPEITVVKGANGRWLENNYEMQTDQQGRLMLLGRTEGIFNHLYVWDAKGVPVATLDLGFDYTSAATLSNELAFISEANNDEIAVLNFSGEVIQRFKTDNQQPPYLLRAYKDKLYAVTQDAVLVYDIATL